MKPRRTSYRTGVMLIAAALTLGAALPGFAAEGGGTSAPAAGSAAVLSLGSAPPIGQVKMNDSAYFELKNLTMLPEPGNRTVTFTVTVHNDGDSELLFIDYWVRLRTKNGQQISVRLLPQDKEKNRITAKSSEDISFYATVNEKTLLSDLVFDFIKWDFSQPNFERKIGDIAVPDAYSVVTPAGTSHTVDMAGNPVSSSVKKVLLSKNEKNYTPTVVLTLENTGTRSAALPAYQFLLKTSEGYMYPLDAKGVKDLVINPKVSKDIDLTGSVPNTVSTEGWQLVIVQNAADLKLNLPVAFYALPDVTKSDGGDTGKEYSFTNEEGTYTAQLNTVQRLPWEDEDLLTAGITLTNKGPESLPIPELAGYFMLEDKVKVEAKLVRTDKVIGLAPSGGASFQFVGKIPYTYEFGKVKLVLQEKKGTGTGTTGTDGSKPESGGETSDLLEFTHRSELMSIPYINKGETYKNTAIGRSMNYKIRSVTTYPGETADTLTTLLEVTNTEKRFADIAKLVAQFKTSDGTVFPAAVSEVKTKVGPGNPALVMLSATIPKGSPSVGMHVLIGDAVTGDALAEGEEKKPEAYVNAAAFWLPTENFIVQDNLKNIALDPYELTFSNVRTKMNETGIQLLFDYDLKKKEQAVVNMEGRKIVIEVVDEAGKFKFSQEYDGKDLEGTAAKEGGSAVQNDASSGTMTVGSHKDRKIDVPDPNAIYSISFIKNYKFNVYDSFKGQKKLIASKSIQWFTTME
ncbi:MULTISPECIES: hypothetical protein [Paenibacillus]|uniref:hypothetical protein n=1 Tax=Paenibacillus TaxID=44249 RepID=UPI0022B8EB5A|nr:hypothetical protein [Paenibacillus caseinilyticus]MCZ8518829.1 hypothetical protein [Paenibacillus caseinilyticus]